MTTAMELLVVQQYSSALEVAESLAGARPFLPEAALTVWQQRPHFRESYVQ